MANCKVGFTAIEQILHSAETAGIFNEVKINPPSDEKENY